MSKTGGKHNREGSIIVIDYTTPRSIESIYPPQNLLHNTNLKPRDPIRRKEKNMEDAIDD